MNNRLFEAIVQSGIKLSLSERVLLDQLVYMCKEEAECWPRTRTLAKRSGLSLRRAQTVLKSLREKGFLVVLEEATPYSPPRYRVTVPGEGTAISEPVSRTGDSQYRVQEIRGTAPIMVPAQAGTKRELKKEHKGTINGLVREVLQYDPSKMVPCSKPGCTAMTINGWCNDHRQEGLSRNRTRGF